MGLLDGLAAAAGEATAQITAIVTEEGAHLLEGDPRLHRIDIENVGAYRRLPFHLWQQTAVLRQVRPDWFVSTFFLPPVIPCRAAVLIHDLSFRAHPEYFPPSIAAYMRLLTGQAIRRANLIVALSEFTRRELLRYYPTAGPNVVVVYPGVGDEFQPNGVTTADNMLLADLDLHEPYLLAVGNIQPRKNLARLLEAWERIRDQQQTLPVMVWVGLDRWGSGELVDRARAAGVRLLGFVPPSHLPTLYRSAQALAYPSLYEGFGLPPLEAMACGTPVLAANTTSLPEAVGDAAVTVDPTNVAGLADGLAQVLFNDALRRDLRAKGLAHAARFHWSRTAAQLLDFLKRDPTS
jgi:glycosyltransferase involved in cell wall biosynthesis